MRTKIGPTGHTHTDEASKYVGPFRNLISRPCQIDTAGTFSIGSQQ